MNLGLPVHSAVCKMDNQQGWLYNERKQALQCGHTADSGLKQHMSTCSSVKSLSRVSLG